MNKCVKFVALTVILYLIPAAQCWHGLHGHHGHFGVDHKDHKEWYNHGSPDWLKSDEDNYSDYNDDVDPKNWGHSGWVFPEPDDSSEHDQRFPKPGKTTKTTTSTTTPKTTSTTTTSTTTRTPATSTSRSAPSVLNILLCIRTCPVTPEYNPVCGSNNVTYNNPGRLECAKACGIDVSMQRASPCPRPNNVTVSSNNQTTTPRTNAINSTTAASSTTRTTAATAAPTRFTIVDFKPSTPGPNTSPNNGGIDFTIPEDLLASIFNNAIYNSTTQPDFDLDIRQQEQGRNV